MKRLICLLWFCGCAHAAVIADVRVAAGVPVAEPDLLAVLEARVAEAGRAGLFEQEDRKMRERFQSVARRPVNLKLPRAQEDRVVFYNVVPAETTKTVRAQATREALEALSRTYLFIDTDDVAERRWAIREKVRAPTARIVAVAGNLVYAQARKTEASLAAFRLFADQGASLVRRFGISAHPARVDLRGSSSGVMARVQEVRLTEESR